jgi:4-hydroxy-tetrahydrodipicolinate synthase
MSAASLSPTGCGTALATPFTSTGAIDESALRRFVDWQIDEGIDFLVPCGSTGEAATMSLAEHRRVVEIVVQQARGRVPVVAGAGSNDTRKAIELSRELKAVGATHLLHVAPMYSRPPQRGMALHFRSIADAVDLPVILYNVPTRTGCNIEAATTIELAAHRGIVGTKEASGLLPQITDILFGRPDGFAVLSGDDEITLAICALGGDGLISVASNAAPRLMGDLVRSARAGDLPRARELHRRALPLMRAASVESNPIPIKAALAMLGRFEPVLRSPLVTLDPRHESVVRSALQHAGVL